MPTGRDGTSLVGHFMLSSGEVVYITHHCVVRWQQRSEPGTSFKAAIKGLKTAAARSGQWVERPEWYRTKVPGKTRWLKVRPDVFLIVGTGRKYLTARTCVYPGIGLRLTARKPGRVQAHARRRRRARLPAAGSDPSRR